MTEIGQKICVRLVCNGKMEWWFEARHVIHLDCLWYVSCLLPFMFIRIFDTPKIPKLLYKLNCLGIILKFSWLFASISWQWAIGQWPQHLNAYTGCIFFTAVMIITIVLSFELNFNITLISYLIIKRDTLTSIFMFSETQISHYT